MKVIGHLRSMDLKDVPAQARKLEELGYDGVNSNETAHNPFLPLPLIAEHTSRVTFGTSVAIAFPRSPMVVANMCWDLQKYSGGRMELGLGSQVKGHNERRFSTPWGPPGPRMREYVLALRAIWDCWQNGTRLNFQGQYYTFTLMTPFFNPGPIEHPHIKVFLAGLNPYMVRLAAEVGDGILLHGFNTPKYTSEVIMPNLEAGAKKAGKSLKDIEITGGGFILTGEKWEDIEKMIRPTKQQIAFYGSTRTYHPILRVHGWEDVGMRLYDMSLKGQWEAMADQITDEMLEAFAVIGTYDEIVDKVTQRYGGMLTRISFQIPIKDQRDEERLKGLVEAFHRI